MCNLCIDLLLLCCIKAISLFGNPIPGRIKNIYVMAITNSMGVGRSKKSMGNVTYRTVRGRTIGSQKRSKGATGATTRGQGGNIRKPLFAMINMFMMAHASDIQVSFNKSKYGSERNYYFTANYKAMSIALNTLALAASSSGELPSLSDIEAAVTAYATANPTSLYRVKLQGFAIVYQTSAWLSEDNPVSGGGTDGLGYGKAKTATSGGSSYVFDAPTAMSLEFHAGAKIVRDAGKVTLTGVAIPSGVTASTIVYLGSTGAPITPALTLTNVESTAGSLSYSAPEITSAMNVFGVKVGNVFVRLSSAYVKSSPEDENPLG